MATYDLENIPGYYNPADAACVEVHSAASVIVLRGAPFEILLIRRHQRSSFLPDAWVFPGGRLEDQDRRGDELSTMRACAVRELREETGLEIADPQNLVCTARWITPPGVHRRFDTWFFLAHAPEHAAAVADQIEGTEVLWVRPRAALDQHARSVLNLVLPTRCNLEAIAGFSSARELMESRRNVAIRTVRPQIVEDGGRRKVIVPD